MLRTHRLRSRHDFKRIFQRGNRINGKYFTLYYLENKQTTCRWAVVVSTKVSKRAVRRNRLRRRLNSLIRESQAGLRLGYDIVIVVKTDFFMQSTDTINLEYAQVISKSGLLRPPSSTER
jgi:ribonuclease P protein component